MNVQVNVWYGIGALPYDTSSVHRAKNLELELLESQNFRENFNVPTVEHLHPSKPFIYIYIIFV